MSQAAITTSYRAIGPESSTWGNGLTNHTLVFRPECNIPPNSKMSLDMPSALGTVYVTGITVDSQNVITGSGQIPADVFSPLSEQNSLRMPAFSAITPLRVTLVSTTAAPAATPIGAVILPPDRMDIGVQQAAARGRAAMVAAAGGGRAPRGNVVNKLRRRLRGFDDEGILGDLTDEELLGVAAELGMLPADGAYGLGNMPADAAYGLGAWDPGY